MVSASVRVTVEWLVPIGESRPIVAALHSLMMAARVERGCVGCSLSTDVGERVGVAFRYIENWETEEDLRRTLLVEHAIEAPTISFALPSGLRGVEYAEEVRADTGGSGDPRNRGSQLS